MVAADYGQVLGIAETYFSAFTKTEQANIFGGNAARFYNL
jgi:predicted TIM-barrel fold metal-dependent hydrolase